MNMSRVRDSIRMLEIPLGRLVVVSTHVVLLWMNREQAASSVFEMSRH
jgi:hypothetical protein